MKLETENGIEITEPSPEQIRSALEALKGYAILGKNALSFIQTSRSTDGAFARIEYQEGDIGHRWECTDVQTLDHVVEVFSAYARGDESWRTDLHWRKVGERREVELAPLRMRQDPQARGRGLSLRAHLVLSIIFEFLAFGVGAAAWFYFVFTLRVKSLLLIGFAGAVFLIVAVAIPRMIFRRMIGARCPACGGTLFRVSSHPITYRCKTCGHTHETSFSESGFTKHGPGR